MEKKEFYPSSAVWDRVEEGILNNSLSLISIITGEGKIINIWGEDLTEKYQSRDPSPTALYQYIRNKYLGGERIIYIHLIDNDLGDIYYIKEKYISQIEGVLKEKIKIIREGKEKYIIFE